MGYSPRFLAIKAEKTEARMTYTMPIQHDYPRMPDATSTDVYDIRGSILAEVQSPGAVLPAVERQMFLLWLQEIERTYSRIGTDILKEILDIKEGVNILLGLATAQITTETIYIQSLKDSDYRLLQPIPVTISTGQEEIVARYEDVGLYGSGEFRQEALAELCASIIDYYEVLSAEQNNLGPLPQRHWEFLRDIIQKVR